MRDSIRPAGAGLARRIIVPDNRASPQGAKVHETALADAVVTTALREAERHGLSTITEISVRIGELQRIDREVFAFALREVMPAAEPRLAGVRFRIETEAAEFHCRPCGRTFGTADMAGPGDADEAEAIHFVPELAHAFLRCPACSSPDFEVVRGRGVGIDSIEGD